MPVNFVQLALVGLAAATALIVVASVGAAVRRRRRERRDGQRLAEAREAGLDLPTSLHPVIDPDLCSGCLSCLDVCPEGDLFGMQGGKAVMIESARCIGHGLCEEACPTGAISLVFGSAARGVDLPETDENFETSRPGVHIIGELGGVGLIKNALKQGLDVARYLRDSLTPGPAVDKDVAIVGAGPAGIATALGCRALNLSFRIIDQETVGGAIASYPRQKLVLMEPVRLPLVGTLGKSSISKEGLLDALHQALDEGKITVHERVRAEGIQGRDGAFTVMTSAGDFTARKVVLALGRRGTPNKLGVPGEELAKVTYLLVDAEQYRGRRVLIVGGGDSALEAAIQLAEVGVDVTLSYRREAFRRCRRKNREKVAQLAQSGAVKLHMSSNVVEIHEDSVVLTGQRGQMAIPNDFVIICAGGTLPIDFLESADIEMTRHHGDKVAHVRGGGADAMTGDERSPVLWAAYALAALAIVALSVWGWDYYRLDRADRITSNLHDALRPSGTWGHGIGFLATFLMIANFLYSARKRLGWWKTSSLRKWMSAHVFFGLFGSTLVAYHAAFQSNNVIATATTFATLTVVLAGLIGRYFYGLLPGGRGTVADLRALKDKQKQLERIMAALGEQAHDPRATQVFTRDATLLIPAKGGNLWNLILRAPWNHFRFRRDVGALAGQFGRREDFRAFRRAFLEQVRVRAQIVFYTSLRRFVSVWRVLHVSLALLLVALIVVHIAVSLYLGFGWLLF